MALKYMPTTITMSLLILGTACGAPQDRQQGLTRERVPILYEAYYPEQHEWSPRANLEEIEKLHELTSKLLKQEEELGKLAAAAAEDTPENIFEPREQILEYVFSGPARPLPASPPVAVTGGDDVQVASLTVSDAGRHKVRHHHGDREWFLRRVHAASK